MHRLKFHTDDKTSTPCLKGGGGGEGGVRGTPAQN